MPQTPEAELFLKRVLSLPEGPGIALDQALQPSLDDEAELRRLFATDKANPRLSNPYVGLVDVFHAPSDIRTTRTRVVRDDDDLIAKYVMPLSETNRRKGGTPSMVSDLDAFMKNWSIFTENSLSQLFDWNNVVAAGGSVLACLSPLPEHSKVSKRAVRKYYHSAVYPTSDVDLFLWGLTAEQAEAKINSIYEAVRDSVPWDVTCVRSKHTVSIHSQYPYRSVQIVLRLYRSPAEILAGFDIDAPCCLFDGKRVWANPRAIVAMMRQCNTVDMTRRSPSYEVRLAKYSGRGFEVYVPTLRRNDVDPTIFERSIVRIEGLARLLVLEKLTDTDTRYNFLQSRRTLRGRPNPLNRYARRKSKYKGDLKADTSILALQMNDYDVGSLHIPYGPGWDARRIDKLVYRTDLGMNSTFNPKNKGRRLHRHPAFFGTMEECLEDCCEHCPTPIEEDERKLQEEEDKQYIRGRIAFIEENPGRQSISGSFNPIDVGEWSQQVYIGPAEKFFTAIAAQNRAAVSLMMKDGIDLNRRDPVGRTPLHVAIISKSIDVACDLIDAGARMTARLVDGRTSLHLAAQLDQFAVVRKLLERSAVNAEQVKKATDEDQMDVDLPDSHSERASSDDDWSSEDEPPKKPVSAAPPEAPTDNDDIPEDENLLDVLDINLPDWDLAFTPLSYAILFASLSVTEELLVAGADPKLVTRVNHDWRAPPLHPLSLTILTEDEDRACELAKRLLLADATSSAADDDLCTIFHRAAASHKSKLVSTLLRFDPNADTVLNFPSFKWSSMTFPIVTTLIAGHYSTLAVMLAHGAKFVFKEEDVALSLEAALTMREYCHYHNSDIMHGVHMPAEVAIARHDDVIELLIALGADVNLPTKHALQRRQVSDSRRSLIDWVRFAIQSTSDDIAKDQAPTAELESSTLSGWKGCHANLLYAYEIAQKKRLASSRTATNEALLGLIKMKDHFADVERLLVSHHAKTWNEIYPDEKSSAALSLTNPSATSTSEEKPQYMRISNAGYGRDFVPQHLSSSYDELYEACFTGNNEKIQQLCLPPRGSKTRACPLQISAQTLHPNNKRLNTGYTPLFAAICGRQWATARLVLAIAGAQYCPDEKEEKFTTNDITLDDSDDESDGSCESDDTIDQQDINFIDVANQPSTVKCDVPPEEMLHEVDSKWPMESGDGIREGNILCKSVADNDFEAFIKVADLYKALPEPIEFGPDLLELIINLDRPEMLDEFIRRTGLGTMVHKEGEEDMQVKNKMYLGLSVHGKKRMDLAKWNDPNAPHDEPEEFPLLWKAAFAGAQGIVNYLSGDRPLAAYRFYLSSSSEERAGKLRRTANLDQVLPAWLGWTVSPLGESPLTAAVLGKNLELMKQLFAKSPRLMTSALHERVKFLGYNLLMLAVDSGSDTALIDYLLAKAVSPAETDQIRGWNVYHILCHDNRSDVLDHLLHKLPRDVNEALLSQQSKGRLNTPLHIAVATGGKRAVKLITDFTKNGLRLYNVDGATPLHAAVKRSFPEITKLLVDAGPTEVLYMENGVGETPLDIVSLTELHRRTSQLILQDPTDIDLAVGYVNPDPNCFDVEKANAEITRLRVTLDELLRDGRLRKDTKLANSLLAFADRMEGKLTAAKALAEDKDEKDAKDTFNVEKTLLCVRNGVAARPSLRRLVHLIDVQRSVQASLPQYGAAARKVSSRWDREVLQPEEDKEEEERRGSLVFKHVHTRPDDY